MKNLEEEERSCHAFHIINTTHAALCPLAEPYTRFLELQISTRQGGEEEDEKELLQNHTFKENEAFSITLPPLPRPSCSTSA